MFAETTRLLRGRAAQWQAIVAARANHRLCHVFEKPADYLAFSLEIPTPASAIDQLAKPRCTQNGAASVRSAPE